ncbi:amidase [Alicyclobacillus cycloheptanicus]|uniref:Amidase n=1 Tax=Alicyclobacillus cycloheptanicus TaxID=1457 RepID=A0ABT9XKG4_9BACL|nr:amidase [Alicyclobacillus cycloheptanicus]MDQ0190791.1 amidase [Alicyclobacillus cycloheptanicus]WDM02727.1 amidase [Alicyclobacillus cycloheptanicus]
MADLQAFSHEDWMEATIYDLQAAMAAGRLTAVELTATYMARVARFNHQGPALNAVLELNPDAMHIAAALDEERQSRGPRSLLHGIPVLVKDNIDTADKTHTSAGSLALADRYAAADAFLVRRLRAAGAVMFGKANMTEWANFMSDHMPSGYSSRGGQVQNPYGPGTFDVGGSSSGSGAAVAANLAAAAVGTETSGSILSPASQNSIVGIKPTVGLISRSGIIPISFSQDTAGPMARTVADAAILLGAMTGEDLDDPATGASRGRALRDYTVFLDPNGLKGARIGIPREPFYTELPPEKQAIIDAAVRQLQDLGAVVVDPAEIPTASADWDINVLVYEFKPALNAFLGRLDPTAPIHSLQDLISYNAARPETMLKYGQALLEKAEATSGTLTEAAYIDSRLNDVRRARDEGIDAVMQKHNLDALLFPNNWGAGIAAKAGYPSITVPSGYTPAGEPVGITLTGMAYSEPTLIRLAYAYEQATRHRVPPAL